MYQQMIFVNLAVNDLAASKKLLKKPKKKLLS